MADQTLWFKIGSVFSKEGFTKAQTAVKDMAGEVKRGAAVFNQMASVFGELDGSAAKAMGAMGGLLTAISSLSVSGIAVQGAMLLVTKAVSSLKEEMEATKARAAELKESVDRAFGAAIAENASGLRREVAAISGEFERVAKFAREYTAALNGLRSSTASGGVVALEVEKLNKMLEAHTEEERKSIEATYAMRIAREKAANVEEAAALKIETAHDAVVEAQNRVANIEEQLAAIAANRATLEEALARQRENNGSKQKELSAQIAALMENESALLEKQNAERDRVSVLMVEEERARQEATNATATATASIKSLELSQLRQAEAAEAARLAAAEKAEEDRLSAAVARQERAEREAAEQDRKDAADAAKALADAEREVAERIRNDADAAQKDAADAAKALADAERAYAAALEKYEKNYAENVMTEDVLGQSKKGKSLSMGIPVRVQGSIKADVVAKDLETAVKDGLVKNVREMDAFARRRAKEVDQLEKTKMRQLERETQKYNRLREQNAKTWSKKDADFVKKFEQIRAAAEAQKKDLEDAKQRVQEERRRAKENHDNLKTIKDKLTALGLK